MGSGKGEEVRGRPDEVLVSRRSRTTPSECNIGPV